MNSLITALIFTVFLFSSVQALNCLTDNPCGLDDYFTEQRGYRCYQLDPTTALCACAGSGYERDIPCRLCNRLNPANNVCANSTGRLRRCLETDDFGPSYACLCGDPVTGNTYLTADANCNPTVTLTTPATTTTGSAAVPGPCANGGVLVNGFCHCPSGFSGVYCQDKNDADLCQRVYCKNGGVCAVRNPNGPYESVCLCRYGTWGDYCELNGTLGFCSSSSCSNGGACKENVVGTTRHAYCRCPAGYNGVKCENRYFPCTMAGKFLDLTMYDQGKYIECTAVGTTFRAEQKSCPKGLRFNQGQQLCTL